jgi:hypothetical protein
MESSVIPHSWGTTATRINDLAVTPDSTRLAVVGESSGDPSRPIISTAGSAAVAASAATGDDNNNSSSGASGPPMMLIVYDFTTKQPEL